MCILFSHNRRALTRRTTPRMSCHHACLPWCRPDYDSDPDDSDGSVSVSDADPGPGFPPALRHGGYHRHHRQPMYPDAFDEFGPGGPPPVEQMAYAPPGPPPPAGYMGGGGWEWVPPPPPPPPPPQGAMGGWEWGMPPPPGAMGGWEWGPPLPGAFYGGYGGPPGWGPYGCMRGGGEDDEEGGVDDEGGNAGEERKGGEKALLTKTVGDLPALVEGGGVKGAVEWEEWAVGGTGRGTGTGEAGGGKRLVRMYRPGLDW